MELEAIKEVGGGFARYLYPAKKRFVYRRSNIYIGVDRYGNPISLSLSTSQRICIIAPTGSGKTYLTRSIIDRAYKAGILPIILTDLKGEY